MEAGSKPQGSQVILRRRRHCDIYVEVPPPAWTCWSVIGLIFPLIHICLPTVFFSFATFAAAVNVYSAKDTLTINIVKILIGIVGLVICFMMCFIFWRFGFHFLLHLISIPYTRQILHIGRQTYGIWTERRFRKRRIEENCEEGPHPSRALGETRNLTLAELIPARTVNNDDERKTIPPYLRIKERSKKSIFGVGLDIFELEWVLKEVNQLIREVSSSEEALNMV